MRIRKEEATNACKFLNAKPLFLDLDKPKLEVNEESINKTIEILRTEKPDIVFSPPCYDAHPTHRRLNQIMRKAIKSSQVEQIWFYETWTLIEKPNFIFFFDEDLMKIKVEAMKKHESQVERLDFINAIKSLDRLRGIMGQELIGGFAKSYHSTKKYGEAFKIESHLTN